MNRRARPVGYQAPRDYVAANFASRTMRWTGVIVLAFLAFHLADLTWGAANGSHFVRGDPYNNLVYSFRRPVVAVFYVIANLALGVHIFHGAWSLFQSLGINNPRINKARAAVRAGIRRGDRARQHQLPDRGAGPPREAASAPVRRRPTAACLPTNGAPAASRRRRADDDARVEHPARAHRRQVGRAQVLDQAREPRRTSGASTCSSSAPASPARRRPRRSPSSATRCRS